MLWPRRRAEQSGLEEQLDATTPRLSAAQDTWYRLSALAERLRGTVQLAVQRVRHLSAPTEAHRPGRDPDELEREAAAAQAAEAELHAVVEEARDALSDAVDRRVELEQAVGEAERAHLAAVRAVADRREGLARLAGQVEALRSTSGATAEEIERLSGGLADARERARTAQREFEELQHELDALHAGEVGLDERHEAASAAHATAAQRSAALAAAHREAEQQRASWRARVEALSVGLARKDGSQPLLAAGLPGVAGTVAALLTVQPGAEAAVAAALGAAADALAVTDVDVAASALSLLRAQDAGRAGLLVGGTTASVDRCDLAATAARCAVGDRPGAGPRGAELRATSAPGTHRGGRGPGRGPRAGGRTAEHTGCDRRGRPTRRRLGARWIGSQHERHRGAGGRRRRSNPVG